MDKKRAIRLDFSSKKREESRDAIAAVLSALFFLLPARPGVCRLRVDPKANGVKLQCDGLKEQQHPCFGGQIA